MIKEIIVDTKITIDDGMERSFNIDENLAIELNTELSKLYFINKNNIVSWVPWYEYTLMGTWKYIVLPVSNDTKNE